MEEVLLPADILHCFFRPVIAEFTFSIYIEGNTEVLDFAHDHHCSLRMRGVG